MLHFLKIGWFDTEWPRRLSFEATLETRHNKDSRMHNGQKQRGRVTAIVLVGEKEACCLDECTVQLRIAPVFNGKNTTKYVWKSESQKQVEVFKNV